MSRPLERDLVQRARLGDQGACSALWSASRRWVAAVLLSHLPNGEDLEDHLQEVAMRMCKGIHAVDDPSRFRGWLRSVAVNAARSAGRRARVRDRVQGDGDPSECAAPSHAGHREMLDHVLERMRQLPEELREPLVLRAVDGMTQREIAAALEVPETTIETRLARARRQLRALVISEGNGHAADLQRTRHTDRCLR